MTTLSPTAAPSLSPRAELITIRLSSGRRSARGVAMHCVRLDGRVVARYDARHLDEARAHVAHLNGQEVAR